MKGYVKMGLMRAEIKADSNQVTAYISENFKLKETVNDVVDLGYKPPRNEVKKQIKSQHINV
jgi:hypothetical protein